VLRQALRTAVALLVATLVWLPSLHLFFARNQHDAFVDRGIAPRTSELAARQIQTLLGGPTSELGAQHQASGEWDFMGRTYVAWSLANMALRDPQAKASYLEKMDKIISETLAVEKDNGFQYFLLPYWRARPFVANPPRSIFVDGEIALMLALRRLVDDNPEDKRALEERVSVITERMSSGPVASAESYPDECWTFCNAVALAALTVSDVLDGTDHSPLARRWIETAKAKLTDAKTGLLVSRYAYDGTVMEGPEGSTLWMVIHALAVVDPAFARDQYEKAKSELAGSILGFGYAAEWPAEAKGHADIDSGPVIPLLDVSAGSSGLALVAAKTFDDEPYFTKLVTTLDFAAFPIRERGTLRYAAGNQVGDAVLLYAMALGPAWHEVERRKR